MRIIALLAVSLGLQGQVIALMSTQGDGHWLIRLQNRGQAQAKISVESILISAPGTLPQMMSVDQAKSVLDAAITNLPRSRWVTAGTILLPTCAAAGGIGASRFKHVPAASASAVVALGCGLWSAFHSFEKTKIPDDTNDKNKLFPDTGITLAPQAGATYLLISKPVKAITLPVFEVK